MLKGGAPRGTPGRGTPARSRPNRLCSIFVPPVSYQSPCSLQDKCGARPAAWTPIYHHLMYIKARSPLIAKTQKPLHRSRAATGGSRGAGGCWGSPLARLPALGRRARGREKASVCGGQASSPPLCPPTRSCPVQRRKLRHSTWPRRKALVSEHHAGPLAQAALADLVLPAETIGALVGQGSGTLSRRPPPRVRTQPAWGGGPRG